MATMFSISDYGISVRGYAEFFDGIPAAIFRTTIEGKIVYCNQAFAQTLNQPLTVINNLLNEILAELPTAGAVHPKIVKVHDQIKKMNDIAEKIGSINKYEVMEYVAGIKIVDIDKASWTRTIEDNT